METEVEGEEGRNLMLQRRLTRLTSRTPWPEVETPSDEKKRTEELTIDKFFGSFQV